jgi:ribosomal protein S18 acetylase RimI-like enzyme
MTFEFRPMAKGEEEQVTAMVHRLPADLGLTVRASVTAETIRAWRDEVNVFVAHDGAKLAGACLWFITYSTWRGQRGMHVSDLYVSGEWRGRKLGEALLREAAKDAARRGAEFIKLEVSSKNPRPANFYGRLGFELDEADRLMFLEPERFGTFIEEDKS